MTMLGVKLSGGRLRTAIAFRDELVVANDVRVPVPTRAPIDSVFVPGLAVVTLGVDGHVESADGVGPTPACSTFSLSTSRAAVPGRQLWILGPARNIEKGAVCSSSFGLNGGSVLSSTTLR
jgi:hypothetical protein